MLTQQYTPHLLVQEREQRVFHVGQDSLTPSRIVFQHLPQRPEGVGRVCNTFRRSVFEESKIGPVELLYESLPLRSIGIVVVSHFHDIPSLTMSDELTDMTIEGLDDLCPLRC